MRTLTHLGVLIEEPEGSYLAETDTNGALRSLQAASCTYRMALGPRAGQKLLSLQSLPSAVTASAPELHVNAHGFSLHAAVRWRADQRKNWSSSAATLPGRPSPTNGSSVTAPAKSYCN